MVHKIYIDFSRIYCSMKQGLPQGGKVWYDSKK